MNAQRHAHVLNSVIMCALLCEARVPEKGPSRDGIMAAFSVMGPIHS